MSSIVKQFARRSKTAIIAYKLYNNWRLRRQMAKGNPEFDDGSTHLHYFKSPEESLAYIEGQFDDYVGYGELTPAALAGKRVFELGFGDNVGVALKFLAAGAAYAVCLDKFYAPRNDEQQRRIYEALRATLDAEGKGRFDEAIDLADGVKINPEKLRCVYGVDVEDAHDLIEGEPFDLILSRGAVQDIYEPDAAFAAMDRMLRRGGQVLHKVDLSDQGMFRTSGFNPLTFLTISESLYRKMAVDSGRPNRKFVSYYRRKMAELGYEGKILITEVIGRAGKGDLNPHKEIIVPGVDYPESALSLVREIRPQLAARFEGLPDEELIVSGIFMVARKPA